MSSTASAEPFRNWFDEISCELIVDNTIRNILYDNADGNKTIENKDLNYDLSLIKVIVKFIYDPIFTFQTNHPRITVDKETSLKIISGKFGSIRFGHFIGSYNNIKLSVTFKMIHTERGRNGFGFITSDFKNYCHDGYNKGHNKSLVIYDNGEYFDSVEFSEINNEYSYSDILSDYQTFWNIDEKVKVTIEMNKKGVNKGMIENITRKDQTIFSVNLPKDEKIAIIFTMGWRQQLCQVIEYSINQSV